MPADLSTDLPFFSFSVVFSVNMSRLLPFPYLSPFYMVELYGICFPTSRLRICHGKGIYHGPQRPEPFADEQEEDEKEEESEILKEEKEIIQEEQTIS